MPDDGGRPFWDYPRSPTATRNLVEAARDRGFGTGPCLAETGLTDADLVGSDAVVSGAQELQIVRNLLALTGDPVGLGIEVGTRYQIASAGILGFALLSSPTMRDALAVGLRFSQLSSTFHRFTLTIGDADSVFDLDESDIPPDVRRFLLERDLAAIAGIVPILFGGAMPVGARVQLRSGPDTPLRLLAELLTVEFDSPRNALVFPTELLAAPLPTADPHTAALCVRQCEELLEQRRSRDGIAGEVRHQLLRVPGQVPTMGHIAAGMHIAERTLHRRLAREGTSYRALLDEVRETLAKELLANGLTVKEVSDRLGYSEPAAFTHAYTRWHGAPPRTRLT
ncbi:AraC family transcriptional regulator [Mycobacteroides chelonae]|uniref:AraC family transcriptional regulator n=1 Tax=Mycobacteroides chelonae TaxID=1774 RepID=A0AB73LHT8_MYCCH|nr:AraC family transcriptional regulator [Mycobacteroides chelonae]MBF9329348.1 AraC family transcriptional regulator [Mycobacteroides chelonae]MBF9422870.1 AraC family transcriptional regulator [Mycobacteroides chelonae]MBF9435063.1 AraC family transcriptional regulator [Mycobacteroides chelonae]MBV6363160.1 AraC family transcriptional regulator [Mycobacteroides chelonae]MEC4836678.1 AraC family transcriptional regulator [Mycobacteroides chelonae]